MSLFKGQLINIEQLHHEMMLRFIKTILLFKIANVQTLSIESLKIT